MEAKYMALGQAAKESAWLKKLLEEIGFHKQNKLILIHSNNQGALTLTKNPMFHTRTKHTNILTKVLSKDKHSRFVLNMGLKD